MHQHGAYTGMRSGFALIALVAACAAPGTPQVGSESPAPSGALIAATSPAPNASPTSLPLVQVGFLCRLPFLKQLDGGHWQAGFLSLPAGSFTDDPSAPPGAGYYDHAVSKWVPVGRSAVAPDGLHYAFMTGGSPSQTPGPPRLHVVDAATGVDRVFDLNLPGTLPYGVEEYASDGIYIGSGWEGSAFGYWRVDVASGREVSLGTGALALDDGTGHSWRTVVDPRDPKPALSGLSGLPLPNEVVRRDLKTGVDEAWFYHPGLSLAIAGTFVGGGLLVWAEPPAGSSPNTSHEYWWVSAPGHSLFIAHIEYGGQTMADSRGIWMGSSNGLYLFTRDGGILRVSDHPGDPASGCL